jgi:hypothetical protein
MDFLQYEQSRCWAHWCQMELVKAQALVQALDWVKLRLSLSVVWQ